MKEHFYCLNEQFYCLNEVKNILEYSLQLGNAFEEFEKIKNLYENKEYHKAIKEGEDFIGSSSSFLKKENGIIAGIHCNIAFSYYELNDIKKFCKHMEIAIYLNPYFLEMRVNYGCKLAEYAFFNEEFSYYDMAEKVYKKTLSYIEEENEQDYFLTLHFDRPKKCKISNVIRFNMIGVFLKKIQIYGTEIYTKEKEKEIEKHFLELIKYKFQLPIPYQMLTELNVLIGKEDEAFTYLRILLEFGYPYWYLMEKYPDNIVVKKVKQSKKLLKLIDKYRYSGE